MVKYTLIANLDKYQRELKRGEASLPKNSPSLGKGGG